MQPSTIIHLLNHALLESSFDPRKILRFGKFLNHVFSFQALAVQSSFHSTLKVLQVTYLDFGRWFQPLNHINPRVLEKVKRRQRGLARADLLFVEEVCAP